MMILTNNFKTNFNNTKIKFSNILSHNHKKRKILFFNLIFYVNRNLVLYLIIYKNSRKKTHLSHYSISITILSKKNIFSMKSIKFLIIFLLFYFSNISFNIYYFYLVRIYFLKIFFQIIIIIKSKYNLFNSKTN